LLPILVSFVLLSLAFGIGWVVAQRISGATLSLTSAEGLLRSALVGQAGLASALLVSAIWKPPPQDTLEIDNAIRNARPLLVRLSRRPSEVSLSSAEKQALIGMLAAITEKNAKIAYRLTTPGDRRYSRELQEHASHLLDTLRRTP